MKYLALIFITFLNFSLWAWDDHHLFLKLLERNDGETVAKVSSSTLEEFMSRVEPARLNHAVLQFYQEKEKLYPYKQWNLIEADRQRLESGQRLTADEFRHVVGLSPKAYAPVPVNSSSQRSKEEWFSFFSGEPDWGGDDFLFNKNDKRYGTIPFGEPDRTSSRGSFHMYFNNESQLTYLTKPSLKESMPHLRFLLNLRLAQLARESGEDFWATRFSANALHYLQDVTVPYHSSAVPYINAKTYLDFALAKDKEKFVSDNTQLLTNHHFLYEIAMREFMRLLMHEKEIESTQELCTLDIFQKSLEVLKSIINGVRGNSDMPNWSQLVCSNPEIAEKVKKFKRDPVEFFNQASSQAYEHAPIVEKAVSESFPKEFVSDPSVEVDKMENVSANLQAQDLHNFLLGNVVQKQNLYKSLAKDITRALEVTLVFKCGLNPEK